MLYFKCNNNIVQLNNATFCPQPNRFIQDITPPPYQPITCSRAAGISQSRSAMPCSTAPLKNHWKSEHQCFWLTFDWTVCILSTAGVTDVLLFVMLTGRCQRPHTNSTSPTVNTLLWLYSLNQISGRSFQFMGPNCKKWLHGTWLGHPQMLTAS